MALRRTLGLAITITAIAGCAGGEVDAGAITPGAGGAAVGTGGSSTLMGGASGKGGSDGSKAGGAGMAGSSAGKAGSGTGTGGSTGGTSSGGKGGASGSPAGTGGSTGGMSMGGSTSKGGSAGSSAGGTSAGGTAAGGTAAGGTAAGGTATGGTAAGGTAAGGTAAGGTAAGGTAAGGTAAGGTAAGGTAAGGSAAGGSAGSTSSGYCSLEKAGDCAGLPPVTVDGACAAFADAFCGLYARCNLLTTAQAADCLTTATADCTAKNELVKAVAAGRRSFDGDAAACCLHQTRDLHACAAGDYRGDPICEKATTGLVPLAGDCFAKGDCASGICDLSATCPGKCVVGLPTGAVCGAPGLTCAEGLLCNAKNVCASPACEGASCLDTKCAGGLDCIEDQAAGTGTCTKPPVLGAACGVQSVLCDLETSSCDLTIAGGMVSGTCAAHLDVGGDCFLNFNCKAGLYCVGAKLMTGTKGVCAPQKTGACDPNKDNDLGACSLLDVCLFTTSMCGAPPKVGEACDPAAPKDQCQKSYCDAGTKVCTAKKSAGAACAGSSECLGSCDTLTMLCGVPSEVPCQEP